MNNFYSKPRGSISILAAILLIVVFGFLGLAVDVGYAHVQKTRLQAVADAAALACVIDSEACGGGGLNLFPQVNGMNATVVITYPFVCPDPTNQQGCARAEASQEWQTLLMGALGSPKALGQATAVAGRRAAIPSCVTTVADFKINGTNIMTLEDCSADIGGNISTTNKSGMRAAAGHTAKITVYNGNSPDTCGNCDPAPTGSTAPLPVLPTVNIPSTNFDGSTLTVRAASECKQGTCQPGRYQGKVVLTGPTVLNSGNYVFEGGFETNSQTVKNTEGGVSIYIPGDQDLVLTGHVTLGAPTPPGCSPGSGLVISHPALGPIRSLDLNGSKVQLNLTGIINLSADRITIGGSSSSFVLNGTLVAHEISLNGNMFPKISANSCNNLYQNSRVSLLG